MPAYSPETRRSDESLHRVLDIEDADYVAMNCSASDIHVQIVDTQKLSNIRYDDIDGAMIALTNTAANEKAVDNTELLLTPDIEPTSGISIVLPMAKMKIVKNLGIICTSFFLMFTSFHSMLNVQSSINKAEGMGALSLFITGTATIFSSMFLVSIFIARLGLKLSMCIGMVLPGIFMAANLYPVWGTMVPASILCGIGLGPLWASQSSYISELSIHYAKITNVTLKDSLSYFFGIFYMCLNASKISGSLLASLLLKQDITQTNISMTLKDIEDCVANKQEAVDNATTLERPDDITIYTICGTWIGLAIAGIIALTFLEAVTADGDTTKDGKRDPICDKFLSSAKHFWSSKLQQILIPFSLYYGISNGFLFADFTKSIVGCTLGIQTVGDVMICNGICNTVFAAVIGRLVKNFGQIPFFTLCFLCYGGVQVLLIVWKPGPDYGYLFFILAGMWGVADAILKSQTMAVYGHLFADNTDAAFGSYFMLEAIGYITSTGYSTFVSTDIKLYILLGLLVCSAASYYTVEYIDRKHNTRQDAGTDSVTDS